MKMTSVFNVLSPGRSARSASTLLRSVATATVLSAISLSCLAQDGETRASSGIQKTVTGVSVNTAQTTALPSTTTVTLQHVALTTAPGDGMTTVSGAVSHAMDDFALVSVTKTPTKEVQPRAKAAEIITAAAPSSPVPEPTTWAMLIVGLGVVTLRIRGMGDRSSRIHQ